MPDCMRPNPILALALLAFLTLSRPAPAGAASPQPLLDKQHMLLVHGQPRFILGLYENPQDDAQLKEAIEAGFNLIQCSPDSGALDRVQKFGAMGWVNVGGALDLSTDTAARQQKLAETAKLLSSHPALLVWEGPDELLWNNWWATMEQLRPELDAMSTAGQGTESQAALARRARELFDRGLYAEFEKARAEFWRNAGRPAPSAQYHVDDAPARIRKSATGVTDGIRALRKLDPNHVIWLNHAPRNSLADLRLYNTAVDMAGCDIYPVPPNLSVGHSDLPDKGLTSVGAYTERMRAAAPGKACAMVLQGFGWRDLGSQNNEHDKAVGIGRRPSWAESRFMAYDAIVHGANAILYWGTAYVKPQESEAAGATGRPRLWYDLLRVARELRALEPALVAAPLKPPAIRQAETYGSIDGHGMLCTLRRAGDDFVLLVVNETENGLAFSLQQLPAKLNGHTLYRLYSSEKHVIENGRLRDGIKSGDVHVYATSRRFEDPQARAMEGK